MLKKNKILQYASRFVYYFDGELKRFVKQNSNGWELERAENTSKSPQVIIVARHLYQETLKKLPVENLKQARSILKLEITPSNFGRFRVFEIENEIYGQTWLFDESVPEGALVIPESFIFENNEDTGFIVKSERELFLAFNNSLVYSVFKTNLITDFAHFTASAGIASPSNIKIIEKQEFASSIIQSITWKKIAQLKDFISFRKNQDITLSHFKFFLPATIFFLGYLVLSSAFVFYKKVSVDLEIETLNEGVESVLTVQQKVDEYGTKVEAFNTFLNGKSNSADFWAVIESVLDKATFTSLAKTQGRFVVRGRTDKATDLLEAISKLKVVQDAKFDTPTRNDRGREQFAISFMMVNSGNAND